MKKALKKMLYSKRNSAAEFYNDEDRDESNFMRNFQFGD